MAVIGAKLHLLVAVEGHDLATPIVPVGATQIRAERQHARLRDRGPHPGERRATGVGARARKGYDVPLSVRSIPLLDPRNSFREVDESARLVVEENPNHRPPASQWAYLWPAVYKLSEERSGPGFPTRLRRSDFPRRLRGIQDRAFRASSQPRADSEMFSRLSTPSRRRHEPRAGRRVGVLVTGRGFGMAVPRA